jgi:exosortase
MTRLAKHQAGFAVLMAVSLLIGWRPLVDTFELSWRSDEYTQILLILPISAALIFLERRSLWSMVNLNIRIGSILLAIAVLIGCAMIGWSASLPSDVQLSIRMIALVLWWIGSFVFCFGPRPSRLVLFPLCFLFGLVPCPQLLLSALVALLQQGSAWATHVLFSVFDVPVAQNGVLLTIPGLTLKVAQECSSIRSSSMLLVTTIVLAQLLLRSSWRRALVIGLAIPLSVAKNGLRIFTIAMLGTRVDPGYLTGRFHRQGGIVFFAVALMSSFAFLWALRMSEDLSIEPRLSPVDANAAGD